MADKNDLTNTMTNNNIYILTTINAETTNQLIGQLSAWVDKLSFKNYKQKIYSPYEKIPIDIPILNVYINSNGGKINIMQSLLTLFNMASAHGTIIKTYNLAHADSSASMIAVSGTHGYRYMAENAYNYIHFGSFSSTTSHTDEIKILTKGIKIFEKTTQTIYLNNTKLTQKELTKYYNTEGAGQLYAKECLTKGICDWIITNDGRFINNVSDLKSNQR